MGEVGSLEYDARSRRDTLNEIAERNIFVTAFIGMLLPPVGYLLVGKTKLAIVCAVTLLFLGLGFVIAPIHIAVIITKTRRKMNNPLNQG